MTIRTWTPTNDAEKAHKVFIDYKLFAVLPRPVIDAVVKGMSNKVVDVSFNGEYCFITTESGDLEK